MATSTAPMSFDTVTGLQDQISPNGSIRTGPALGT